MTGELALEVGSLVLRDGLLGCKTVKHRYNLRITLLSFSLVGKLAEGADIHSLRLQLKKLLAESIEVNRRMTETVTALVKGQETFAAAGQPLPNYEVPVPKDSPLIGKSIGELQFWQSTGGTVVAIRRGQTVILSPGPYAELYGGDVIILVGSPSAAEAAHRLVTTKE